MSIKISVIGLGYVGLPLALGFAKKHTNVIGYDIDKTKVDELLSGHDRTGELTKDQLTNTSLKMTCDVDLLSGSDFFIVTVPTPIDQHRRPDLTAGQGRAIRGPVH